MTDDLPDLVRRLRRARLTLSLALTATVALAYFLYIGLLAFSPAAFATPLRPTATTSVGIIAGFAMIALGFASTIAYVVVANARFDKLARAVREATSVSA
jgi:uncharacterized membrane protein (DUF485 family)